MSRDWESLQADANFRLMPGEVLTYWLIELGLARPSLIHFGNTSEGEAGWVVAQGINNIEEKPI